MRLIDADALKDRMYHDAFETDTNMQKWDSGCWIRYKMFENAIEEAPTIEPSGDLISREDAIDAIQNAYCKPCKERGDDHNEVRCRVCEYDNAIIQIDALPSADAVSREDYHNLLMASNDIDRALREYQAKEEDNSDRPKGEWIVENHEVVCSVCGQNNLETNFCPNCGADMRGEEHE